MSLLLYNFATVMTHNVNIQCTRYLKCDSCERVILPSAKGVVPTCGKPLLQIVLYTSTELQRPWQVLEPIINCRFCEVGKKAQNICMSSIEHLTQLRHWTKHQTQKTGAFSSWDSDSCHRNAHDTGRSESQNFTPSILASGIDPFTVQKSVCLVAPHLFQ